MSGKGTSTVQRPERAPAAADRGRSRLGDVTRPVRIDRRIARPGRSSILLAVVALAIAGALAAALFVLPIQTYFDQEARIEERSDQLARMESVNADLRAEVARSKTDDGIREAAREELGFVQDGERRETVLDLPDVPTDLPDGWPYSVVTAIVELRSAPPAATDPAAGDPAGSNTAGSNTTGSDTTGSDTTGSNTTGSNTAGSDTTGSNTAGSDTTGSDTAGSDTTDSDTAEPAATADQP